MKNKLKSIGYFLMLFGFILYPLILLFFEHVYPPALEYLGYDTEFRTMLVCVLIGGGLATLGDRLS